MLLNIEEPYAHFAISKWNGYYIVHDPLSLNWILDGKSIPVKSTMILDPNVTDSVRIIPTEAFAVDYDITADVTGIHNLEVSGLIKILNRIESNIPNLTVTRNIFGIKRFKTVSVDIYYIPPKNVTLLNYNDEKYDTLKYYWGIVRGVWSKRIKTERPTN